MMLTFYGGIAVPPLVLWALGLSWQKILVAELLVGYPFVWLVVQFGRYILRPKLVFAAPRLPLGGRTELNLRERPRE
jgi:hypothetical protein